MAFRPPPVDRDALGKPPPFDPPKRCRVLTVDVIEAVSRALADGASQTDAATASGVAPGTLRKWLHTGRTDLDEDRDTLHANLAYACDAGQSHYRRFLIAAGNRAAFDKSMSTGFLKWRLALSAPLEFSQREGSAGIAGVFDTISPSEAADSLRVKIERFLEARQLEKDAPTEPTPAPTDPPQVH